MKKSYKSTMLIAISLLIAMSSCTSSKKMAIACPEPFDNYSTRVVTKHRLKTHKLFANTKKQSGWKYSKRRNIATARVRSTLQVAGTIDESTPLSVYSERVTNAPEYYDNLYGSIDQTNEIVFEPGPTDVGSDIEINLPQYRSIETIPLGSGVSSEITFRNYISEALHPALNIQGNNQEQIASEKEIEGLGIAGFVLGLAGLLIFAIPFGAVAVIFSGISLAKMQKNPGKYKGKGLSIAGLTVGIIDVVVGIVLVAAML